MTQTEFNQLVLEMRQAQKEYFRTRKTGALIRSKELEKQVDAFLTSHQITSNQ